MRIAMVGTRGVPPKYGGFETAVDEVGRRLVAEGHEVVVYCRNPGQVLREHLGMSLVNLPALRQKSLETLSHTFLSVLHAVFRSRPDVVLLFNAANAPFVPLLRLARIPVAVHLDGLEWKRAKWKGLGRRYFRAAERFSVRWADEVIADAHGIADHVRQSYGRESVYIPYGAPIIAPGSDRLAELGLVARGYHLVVARFEPENHVDMIVEGYGNSAAALPLVVVGSAPYADDYTHLVHTRGDDPRIRFLGPVWDQELLDQLYANCASYLHGHSVGGTNPSLLRAMGAGAPTIAYDVNFNREVTGGHARFFDDASSVSVCVEAAESDSSGQQVAASAREWAETHYDWADVAVSYESLSSRIARRG
jgi:glycosyltransferase involved in cell wall biosynthesis